MSTSMDGISSRHQSGIIIVTPHDHGPITTEPTVSCAHCGLNWVPKKGSGRRVGFCQRCMGLVCGSQNCERCVPVMAYIENLEAGRPGDFRQIIASVPRDIRG